MNGCFSLMTSSLYIFHLSFQIFYRTSLLSAFRAYIILIRWIETLEFVSDWVWHKRSSKSSNEWERMWFTYLLPRFTPIKVNTSWLGPMTKGLLFFNHVQPTLWPSGLQHTNFPVLHCLLEFVQIHVYIVDDAI